LNRAIRKADHIHYALSFGQSRTTGLDDIALVHQSLPNLSVDSISLDTKVGELDMSSPFFINAMTGGGGNKTFEINKNLAIVCHNLKIPMAVGSQMAALKDPQEAKTYEVVRKENPDGVLFANLGSECSIQQARSAVDMIGANALQIHLNVVQELSMPEGDRNFQGALDRIGNLAEKLPVPVIVKETGFGMSKETIQLLSETIISAVDIGGFGGTNFAQIENARRERTLDYFLEWGIPTAASIVEAVHSSEDLPIISSGGVQNSLDVLKCLALGSSAVGMAGMALRFLHEGGVDLLFSEMERIKIDLTFMMCALGTKTINELNSTPLVISGSTYHWLNQRGFSPEKFARRAINK
jgi:isopentenyl-diphosphate delta-isomerase